MNHQENEKLSKLLEEFATMQNDVKGIKTALLGDEFGNQIGYLKIVKENEKAIKDNTDEIVKLKAKIKTPWAKIIGAGGVGMGVGGASTSKGTALLEKLFSIFN